MGKERKYGPNGIEWNEDRKCKVKVKEREIITSPSWVILFFLGEQFYWSAHSFWRVRLYACFVMDVLLGRGVLKRRGRVVSALE